MKNEKYSIAIDLGASGGKTAIGRFNGNKLEIGNYIDFANRPVSLRGALYWDVFSLYCQIGQCLRQYASGFGEAETIAVDAWGASYGLLDVRGRLLEPVYHYRDIRTEGIVEELYRTMDKRELFSLTGCQCNRTYTLPQLFSYRKENNRILELAEKLLFLPDLLGYYFSGEVSTEKTIAGTSCLMESNQGGWSREVFKRFNLPEKIFTQIVEAGTIKGRISEEVSKETGIGKPRIVATVEHDSAAAVAAIPDFDEDSLYISIGTNVSMGVERSEALTSDKAYWGGFKNTGGIAGKKILYRDFSAFWIINELRRIWAAEGKNYSYGDLMAMAKNTNSIHSYIDVEAAGFNSAGGDMRKKIIGYLADSKQKAPAEDGELVRCVLESIVLKIKYCADYIKKELKIDFKKAYVINGGARNNLLVQLISDALGIQIKAGMPYATLAGNVLTQLLADGDLHSVEQMRQLSAVSFDMQVYEPETDRNWDDEMKHHILRNGGKKYEFSSN